MRRLVHAVVIARRRGDRLIQTLEALTGQTKRPDTITVVDLTGDDSSEELFREQLGRDSTVTLLSARPAMGWAEALNLARTNLPDDGWMWVLRDDTTPDPAALKALHSAVDGAPSVVMAGPKQRMADQPGWLREFGETITQWGERQAIVDRELDQGQYDRMSDVLAVGDAGILIQLGALDSLAGADPGLDPLDAPLDLGIRARLAGHRVLVVADAIVYVEKGPADWRVGRDLGPTAVYRLDRAAWLYRRFAYSPWWALVPLVILAIPQSLLRQAWQFALKRPDRAIADGVATLQALWKIPQAIVAKMRLGQSKTVSWAAIRPLRMSPGQHRRRRQLLAEARFARAEDSAQALTRPSFWPAGAWLILALAILGGLIAGPLVGARAIVGGGLLPLSSTLDALWSSVRWLQPGAVDGIWGTLLTPADPAALVLALLGSLTWWSPSLAMVGLWFSAPLIAGLVAWWAGSQFLQRSLATTVFAVMWVVQPTFFFALTEGRWQAVIVHIALPWLLATALTAHTSWQRAAAGGFATALVTAVAPVLWPAIIVGWLVVILGQGWRQPVRALFGTLPLALVPALVWWLPRLSAPGDIALIQGLGRFLADPGIAQASGDSPGSQWWWYLLGWPVTPPTLDLLGMRVDLGVLAIAAAIPLGLVALAVFATSRSTAQVVLGALVGLGLVTAVVSPLISQGYLDNEPVGVWPGSGVALIVLGLAAAAAASLDELSPESWQWGKAVTIRRGLSGVLGTVMVVGATLGALPVAGGLWSDDAPVTGRVEARTLPALVAAEARENPQQGTLIITATDEPQRFSARIERGAGATLDQASSLYRLRPTEAGLSATQRAELVASIVQPTSADPQDALARARISFILFRGQPDSQAALTMGQRPYLVTAGETDSSVLWALATPPADSPDPLEPSPSQSTADLLWLVSWALWGILALPTERRPRRRSEEGDEASSLQRVLEEDTDD